MPEITEEIRASITLRDTIHEVKEKLSKLHISYEWDEENLIIETERLDHNFNSNCKVFTFEFENNTLINFDGAY